MKYLPHAILLLTLLINLSSTSTLLDSLSNINLDEPRIVEEIFEHFQLNKVFISFFISIINFYRTHQNKKMGYPPYVVYA